MVRIPTPQPQGQQVGSVQTAPANTPFMNVRPADLSRPAREMAQIGNAMQQLGVQINQAREDAASNEVQLEIEALERSIYDPETGLVARQRGDAIGVTNEVDRMFEELRGSITENHYGKLSDSGRQAVDQILQGAQRRIWGDMAGHELQQTTAYQAEQGAARIANANAMIGANPNSDDNFVARLGVITDEAEASAIRDGYEEGDDEYKRRVRIARSGAVLTRADALALEDPEAAQRFLDDALEQGIIDRTAYNAKTRDMAQQVLESRATRAAEEALSIHNGDSIVDPNSSLIKLIDREESGGGYDTLLGHANREGGQFAGVDVTEMTIDEASAFSQGEYARYSMDWKRANRHGDASIPSTPMGRYQIVGATLRMLKERMGLNGDEKFDAAMQDRMFEELVGMALEGGGSMAQKMERMRGTWEGFQHASDEELAAAIRSHEAGGTSYTSAEERINSIEDLEERRLARSYYDAEIRAAAQREARAKDELLNGVFTLVNELPQETLEGMDWRTFTQRLGPDAVDLLGTNLDAARNWFLKIKAGEPVQTDVNVYNDMLDMAANDPAGFVEMMEQPSMNGNRFSLNDAAYTELRAISRNLQAVEPADLATVTPSATDIGRAAEMILKGQGLEAGDEEYQMMLGQITNTLTVQMRNEGLKTQRQDPWDFADIWGRASVLMSEVEISGGDLDIEGQNILEVMTELSPLGEDAEVTALQLITAAGDGTVRIGPFELGAAGLSQIRNTLMADPDNFGEPSAYDIIEYAQDALRNSPAALADLSDMADAMQEEALRGIREGSANAQRLAEEARAAAEATQPPAEPDWDDGLSRVERRAISRGQRPSGMTQQEYERRRALFEGE